MKALFLKALVIYCLVGISTHFMANIAKPPESLSNASVGMPTWFYLYFASVFAVALSLMIFHAGKILALLDANKLFMIFFLYLLGSCTWAVSPLLSLSFAGTVIYVFLFGLYLVSCYSVRDLLILLCISMGLIVLLCYFLALFLPAYGIHNNPEFAGSWRGIYTHKNQLSIHMSIAFPLFIIAAKHLKKFFWIAIGFAILTAGLVVLSRSKTGILILAVIIVYPLILPILRLYAMLLISLGIVALCFLGLTTLFIDYQDLIYSFLKMIGKDPSLSGRINNWRDVINVFLDYRVSQFYFGYGAQPVNLTSHFEVVPEQQYQYISIDNAYLNVFVRFGLIGWALFFLIYLKSFVLAMNQLRSGKTALRNCYILVLLVACINGLTENTDQILLVWLFMAFLVSTPYLSYKASQLEPAYA